MELPGTLIKSLEGCSIEPIVARGTPILCVLGCLLTEAGKAIKQEMIDQFSKKYDIIAVNQLPPGKYYEFPALSFAKSVSINSGKPVLYIHTKGAANPQMGYNQQKIRNVWKHEFIDHYDVYYSNISSGNYDVVCPFTGSSQVTWFNGFIGAPTAWKSINLTPSNDRFIFERLFKYTNVRVYGNILNDISNEPPSSDIARLIQYVNSYNKQE